MRKFFLNIIDVLKRIGLFYLKLWRTLANWDEQWFIALRIKSEHNVAWNNIELVIFKDLVRNLLLQKTALVQGVNEKYIISIQYYKLFRINLKLSSREKMITMVPGMVCISFFPYMNIYNSTFSVWDPRLAIRMSLTGEKSKLSYLLMTHVLTISLTHFYFWHS